MKRFLAVLLALAACSKASTGPTPTPQLAGIWQFGDNIGNAALGFSCVSTGPMTVTQNGTNFIGTASIHQVCTDTLGNTSPGEDAVVPVTSGQIIGAQVSFYTLGCQYVGNLSGSPANAMSGNETCLVAPSSTSDIFTGPWQASR